MGLKKISKKLQAVVKSEPDKKKRSETIGKLVKELGSKKRKYEAKVKSAEGTKKKLSHKIEICEAQLVMGKAALRPEAGTSVVVAKSGKQAGGKKRSADKKLRKKEKEAAKSELPASPLQH